MQAMDLPSVEKLLLESAGVIVADPRVIRRVIKHHRSVHGLVPHGRCYPISRAQLLDVADFGMLGVPLANIPAEVILVARPTPGELRQRTDSENLTRLWRAVFHARVHVALQRLVAMGNLDDAAVRERIECVGQTEFDEIRANLRHDDAVLPPFDDREVYVEFAATFLELRYFSPGLLVTTFPGLQEIARIDATLAMDLDPRPLIEHGCPKGVVTFPPTLRLPSSAATTTFGPMSSRTPEIQAVAVSIREAKSLLGKADKARASDNDVRAILLSARAENVADPALSQRASQILATSLAALDRRLTAALAATEEPVENAPGWERILRPLARRAAAEKTILRYGVEARLLYRLQRACVASERPRKIVDLPTWILSWGKLGIVRDANATRCLLVARQIEQAVPMVHAARVPSHERAALSQGIRLAVVQAEARVRRELRPRIRSVLDKVGLVPSSTPEELARDKLIDELVDQILRQGFLSFPQLRDALSRNELKLQDLRGAAQLVMGDPLIALDKALFLQLDGIYQRSDGYLRALQRASSLPFGTHAGRVVFLYVILPMASSFVLLEGLGHIINPLLRLAGTEPLAILSLASFLLTSVLAFALIHSLPFRAFAWQILQVLGVILAWVFFRIPRAIFSLPPVKRFFALPAVRLVLRRVLLPLLLAAAVYYFSPLRAEDLSLAWAGALGAFAIVSGIMGTRLGIRVEDFLVEQLVPTWQVASRQWIPGLLQAVSGVFATAMDWLQRAIYRVDELLRFHRGDETLLLVVRAVAGLGWAVFAYVIRLYVTLLVEPEINPLKHFPVVTVSHKLFLPFTPQALALLQTAFSPLGSILGGALAGVTVFLLPSASGFLMWELKENYRLYRATRPEHLHPSRIGPHGETMRGLLVAGIHSGAVPKLYERLRRAAQRDDELARRRKAGSPVRGDSGLATFRAGIREVEVGIRRFVERELIATIHASKRWKLGRLTVKSVALSSNRIRVKLTCEGMGGGACDLTIEQQAGVIVAGLPRPGFLLALQSVSPIGALLFENALAGFYHRAEVDFVREQLEAELPEGAQYEIAEEGLVVWPLGDFRTEHVYSFELDHPKTVAPTIRGKAGDLPARVLDTRRFLYRHQPVSWIAWVAAWLAADHDIAQVPRLMAGASLLPQAKPTTEETPPPAAFGKPALAGDRPTDTLVCDPNLSELPDTEPGE